MLGWYGTEQAVLVFGLAGSGCLRVAFCAAAAVVLLSGAAVALLRTPSSIGARHRVVPTVVLVLAAVVGVTASLRTHTESPLTRAARTAVAGRRWVVVAVQEIDRTHPTRFSGRLHAVAGTGGWGRFRGEVRGFGAPAHRGSYVVLARLDPPPPETALGSNPVVLELSPVRAYPMGRDRPRSWSERQDHWRSTQVARWRDVMGEEAGTLAGWTLLDVRPPADARRFTRPFERTGTSHLLSISGLHLTMIGGLLWLVLRIATRGARWISGAVALLLTGYAALAGGPAAALRSAGMYLALAAGPERGRGRRLWNALALSILLLVAIEPRLQQGAALVLSGSATAGVMLGARLVESWIRGGWISRCAPLRGPLSLLGASVGATLLTVGWSWHYFGVVYPLGLFFNLIAVPAAGVVLPCQLVAGCAASLGAGPAHPLVALGRESGLALLRLVELGASVCGTWPLAGTISRWNALVVVALSGIVLEGARRALEGRRARGARRVEVRTVRTGRTRDRMGFRRGPILAFALALALVFGLVFALVVRGTRSRERFRVEFLEVGQGDAILLDLGGPRWLFDVGPPASSRVLIGSLLARGVTHLDRVLISHGDLDHWGGLEALLQSTIRVDTLCVPEGAPLPAAFRGVLRGAPQRPVVERLATPFVRRGGWLEVRLLHPWPGRNAPSDNNGSFVLRFDVTLGGRPRDRILLVGDLEQEGESALLSRLGIEELARVTLLQAGHHGSRTAGSAPWLARSHPRCIVASLAPANRFGFPHPEVEASAVRVGARFLTTERDGSVAFEWSARGVRVSRVRVPCRASGAVL